MWKTVKLGDVCDFQGGSQPPKKEFVYEEQKGYVRFIQIRDFKSDKNLTYIPVSNKNRLCRTDDIFIGRYGASVGQILRGLKGAYNVALMKTIPNEEFISKGWLFAYLNSSLFQKPLKEVSSRSAQNGFSKDDISSFELPLPPLAEQERIVAKLDVTFAEIDEAVEGSKKQETEVLKLGYRAITNTLKNLADIYSSKPLNDVVIIQPKKKLALEKISESDDVSFMGMKELGIEQKYSEAINTKPLNEVFKSYQYFEENDVVFAKITPCFENGKLGIMKNLKNGIGFGSSEFVVLRPNKEVHSEYIYYCLLDEAFRKNGTKNMSGAVGHKRVTKDYYFNYQIAVPPLSMQIECIRELDEIWKQVEIISKLKHKKINELISLKSAILKQELQSSEAA